MDYRTNARADTAEAVDAHQPGEDGTCPICHVTHPCGPLLLAERALAAAEARHRTSGDAGPTDSTDHRETQ